ncbi:MAG: hypothetical protein HYX84_05495 [Chloroflexi bacterium]|nr:hypothetical protein [Chloroflexota bacterium]
MANRGYRFAGEIVVFFIIFASLLLVGGTCWLIFLRRWLLWFTRKMNTEQKAAVFSSTRLGRLALWRLRMSGILQIALGLSLLAAILPFGFLEHIPGFVFIILVALPIVSGMILVRVAVMQMRKQNASQADRGGEPSKNQ